MQVAEEDEQVPGVDPREVQRSEARSDKEELRCVIAVIRHGGTHVTINYFRIAVHSVTIGCHQFKSWYKPDHKSDSDEM